MEKVLRSYRIFLNRHCIRCFSVASQRLIVATSWHYWTQVSTKYQLYVTAEFMFLYWRWRSGWHWRLWAERLSVWPQLPCEESARCSCVCGGSLLVLRLSPIVQKRACEKWVQVWMIVNISMWPCGTSWWLVQGQHGQLADSWDRIQNPLLFDLIFFFQLRWCFTTWKLLYCYPKQKLETLKSTFFLINVKFGIFISISKKTFSVECCARSVSHFWLSTLGKLKFRHNFLSTLQTSICPFRQKGTQQIIIFTCLQLCFEDFTFKLGTKLLSVKYICRKTMGSTLEGHICFFHPSILRPQRSQWGQTGLAAPIKEQSWADYRARWRWWHKPLVVGWLSVVSE